MVSKAISLALRGLQVGKQDFECAAHYTVLTAIAIVLLDIALHCTHRRYDRRCVQRQPLDCKLRHVRCCLRDAIAILPHPRYIQ
jgi:hypothetical protein